MLHQKCLHSCMEIWLLQIRKIVLRLFYKVFEVIKPGQKQFSVPSYVKQHVNGFFLAPLVPTVCAELYFKSNTGPG